MAQRAAIPQVLQMDIAPISTRPTAPSARLKRSMNLHSSKPSAAIAGFGPLQPFLDDPAIAEIGINEADRCSSLGVARLVECVRQEEAHSKARRPGLPAHDDLVERDFAADAPNRVWLADITEHPTGEGKIYLCAIKDVWSNRIVGYSIDSRMKSRLAVAALDNAVGRRGVDGGEVAGCSLHTDRGSQFRSRKVQRALTRHSMVGSMGQVGSAADNAAMESFFSLLQKNVLDRHPWATREELRIAIVTWIERTYHRRRRQRSLSRLTPLLSTRPS